MLLWASIVARTEDYIVSKVYLCKTSSNHRLESAGLNALEELLLLGMGRLREYSNAYLVCKRN